MQSLARRLRVPFAGLLLGMVLLVAATPWLESDARAQPAEVGEDGEPKPPPAEEKPSKLKAVAGYALSAAGTFVVAALVIHTLSKTLKYESARNAMIHLLRSNPNQAEVQCYTLPNSFYTPIGAAIKMGAMTAGVTDPEIIKQATLPTYDANCAQVVQHWKGLVGKAKLATVAACGAVALKTGILTISLAVVAVGGLLWLWFYKSEVERSLFRAKIEVLPEVDRALVDGRYYTPPKP
jgi:hypothetical protein